MDKKRTFLISGMHCAGCAAAVERAVAKLPVREIYVNFASGRLNFISAEGIPEDEEVILAVKKAGFTAQLPPPGLCVPPEKSLKRETSAFLLALFFTILLLIVCMGHIPEDPGVNGWCQLILIFPVLFAGRGFFKRGIPALLRGGPNMDSLISCGALAGIIYSVILMIVDPASHLYFDAAGMIITLIMLGKLLEARSRRSASAALKELLTLIPPVAHLVSDGKECDIPAGELLAGDMVRILPGEKIPADGVICEGRSFVNESMLTGEELPAPRGIGDNVYGGTLNTDGTLLVKITGTGSESMLGQIVKLIDEAQDSRPPVAALADKVSGIFVWGILGAALLTAALWGIFGTGADALHFSLSVMVVACPCALGLATPVALISGIGRGAVSGILIRNGAALEKAAKIEQLVFDKTGTLTAGIPRVIKVECTGAVSEDELLSTAAAVERFSEHPLAKAVCDEAEKRGVFFSGQVTGFQIIPGMGVTASVNGMNWSFGNHKMMEMLKVDVPEISAGLQGFSLILAAKEKVFCGVIAVGDSIRREAAEVISELKKSGISCFMLTGDNSCAAGNVAKELNLDGFRAGLLPGDKVSALQEIRRSSGNKLTGMVGDGINDAPALMAGDIGIAVGSGSDIALESADVILMRTDLHQVSEMIRLSRAVFRVIRQNLFWAFFYNILGIPLAAGLIFIAGGPKFNPAFCAGAMACSSLTVVLNALRLRWINLRTDGKN